MKSRSDRLVQIDAVLNDLRELLSTNPPNNWQYALKENITFFEAARSPWRYLRWVRERMPHIDGRRLLELTDFPFERWDKEMHRALSALQKKTFPGLIEPLVKKIVETASGEGDISFILDAGAGAAETDAQAIKRLKGIRKKIFFICVDQSDSAFEIAKQNSKELQDVKVHEFDELDEVKLKWLARNEPSDRVIILCKNDIFVLNEKFGNNVFDLAFSSLFLHHLTEAERKRLDGVEKAISKKVIEYDGCRERGSILLQSITAWNNPVFLNASIFSILRYPTRREIERRSSRASFFWVGTYLLELK